MDTGTLTDVLDVTTSACDSVDRPVDTASAPELLRAANGLSAAIARLRAVANTDCEPPDLDGLCAACGRKLAERVPSPEAGHGCNIFDFLVVPAFRLRRLVVRTWRLGRLMWAAAHRRGSA